jgi:hypothetical protein
MSRYILFTKLKHLIFPNGGSIFWQLLGDLSSGEPFQLKTKVKKVRQLCDRTTLNGSVRSVGDEDLDEVKAGDRLAYS